MPRSGPFVAAVFLVVLGPLSAALAQPQPPAIARPSFSPYLNLLRPGANPAVNYYGLVQPQFQFQRQVVQLQSQINQNAQNIQALNTGLVYGEDPNFPVTGHSAVFNSLGHYFYNSPVNYGSMGGANRGYQNPYQAGVRGSGSFGPARPTLAARTSGTRR